MSGPGISKNHALLSRQIVVIYREYGKTWVFTERRVMKCEFGKSMIFDDFAENS